MGGGVFDPKEYDDFKAASASKPTEEIYSSTGLHKDLDPKDVKFRESRDSVDNPNSTPAIIGIDVTGSMNIIAETIARKGLGVLFESILDRKPISDPHVMFMGIGDANFDQAPLQVSQFEADKRVIEQLTQIYLEHGGGGNNFESYNLPWYFAALHTVHDSFEKRGKRGYLFTVGDEKAPKALTRSQIKRFIGDDVERDLEPLETLEQAQRYYDVYHIIIKEGDYARSHLANVEASWKELLGQKVIPLADHTKLAETIVSTIEVAEGRDADVSTGLWGGVTATIVHDAIKHLPRGSVASAPKMIGKSL